jgi:TATA-box binding protein (TBP) (component of TFIID and TFIIIB)
LWFCVDGKNSQSSDDLTYSKKIDFSESKKQPHIIHDTAIYGGRVAYFKSPEIMGRVTIFPSGNLISVGTKGEVEAIFALEPTKNFLARIKMINDIELHFKIQNLVAIVYV